MEGEVAGLARQSNERETTSRHRGNNICHHLVLGDGLRAAPQYPPRGGSPPVRSPCGPTHDFPFTGRVGGGAVAHATMVRVGVHTRTQDVVKELDLSRKRAAKEAELRAEAIARGFEYAGPDGSPLIEEVAAGPPLSLPPLGARHTARGRGT